MAMATLNSLFLPHPVQLEKDARSSIDVSVVVFLGALPLEEVLGVHLTDLAGTGRSVEVTVDQVGLLRVGLGGAQQRRVVCQHQVYVCRSEPRGSHVCVCSFSQLDSELLIAMVERFCNPLSFCYTTTYTYVHTVAVRPRSHKTEI